MPNNRRKTLKTIKGKDNIHPSSRKAGQLARVFARQGKLEKKSGDRVILVNPRVERMLWFRYALDDNIPSATKAEMHDLIEMYIQRHDEELKSLLALHRPDGQRPKAGREELLKALIEKEKNEYISGFEIPDMTNPKNLRLLREFDGDINAIARIKMIRLQDPKSLANAFKQVEKLNNLVESMQEM